MIHREISYLVLATDGIRAAWLVERLRARGCRASPVTTVEEARRQCADTLWICLVFERALATSLDEFFGQFPTVGMCFAPWSAQTDFRDAVNALNSRRCAYYLIDPVPDGELDKLLQLADWQLCGRVHEVGEWVARRQAEKRKVEITRKLQTCG